MVALGELVIIGGLVGGLLLVLILVLVLKPGGHGVPGDGEGED